jgi:hypothetical protein
MNITLPFLAQFWFYRELTSDKKMVFLVQLYSEEKKRVIVSLYFKYLRYWGYILYNGDRNVCILQNQAWSASSAAMIWIQ